MKILIACGGTGGHIFPGLSLYNALKKKQSQINILLALDRRTTTSIIVTGDYPCVYLSVVALKFKFDLQTMDEIIQWITLYSETCEQVGLSWALGITFNENDQAEIYSNLFMTKSFLIKTVIKPTKDIKLTRIVENKTNNIFSNISSPFLYIL